MIIPNRLYCIKRLWNLILTFIASTFFLKTVSQCKVLGRKAFKDLFVWVTGGWFILSVEFSGVEEAYWVQTFGQFWYSSDGERELLQIGGKSLNKCGNFADRCTPCNSVCKFNRELGFANRSTSAAAVLQFSPAMQLSSTCSKRNCRKSITFYNCSHHAVQWRDACEKPI